MAIHRAIYFLRVLFLMFLCTLVMVASTTHAQDAPGHVTSDQSPTQPVANRTETTHPWKLGEPYRQLVLYGRLPTNRISADSTDLAADRHVLVQPSTTDELTLANEWWVGTFQSNRSGHWQIYSSRGNGSDVRQLTFNEADDVQPQLNWEADTIAFVSQRDGNAEIYRMSVDGSNKQRLTVNADADIHPTWAPDGQAIAFVRQDGNTDFDLFQMQADGSTLQQLIDDDIDDLYPNWSPDGTQLVWVKAIGQSGWLWVMDRDGRNAHAISGALRYLQHPVWSPDGSHIGFDYDADDDGYNEIATLRLADGTIQTIQDASQELPPRPGFDLWMDAWSPTGDGLSYSVLEFFWQPMDDGSYLPVPQTLNIDGMCLIEFCAGAFTVAASHSIIWNTHASVRTLDSSPPQSHVNPLPRYQRRGAFFVSWRGQDQGISGIAHYDVQYKTERDPTWMTWQQQSHKLGETVDFFMPGLNNSHTIYFRSRATDLAANQEPWTEQTQGEANTTLFETLITGQVVDARGIARARRRITVIPAAIETVSTDANGLYSAYLPISGEYQLGNVRLDASFDHNYTFYDAPSNNLLRNGDFETAATLSQWQGRGTLSPHITRDHVYEGTQSLVLGPDCLIECLSADTTMPLTLGLTAQPMTTQDGHLHLLTNTLDNGQLLHLERDEAGIWNRPTTIYNGYSFEQRGVGDQAGNLHVVWQIEFDGESQIIYVYRNAVGGWGPPVVLGNGKKPQITLGEDGRVHLLYYDCSEFCTEHFLDYHQLGTDGEPLLTHTLPVGPVYDDAHQIAITKDGTVHLIWPERSEAYHDSDYAPVQLHYATLDQDGNFSEYPYLLEKPYIGRIELLRTNDDTLHLFWDVTMWMQKLAGQPWSSPLHIADDISYVTSDSDGSLHLFTQGGSVERWQYRNKPLEQSWSAPYTASFENGNFGDFFVDDQHQFMLLGHSDLYQSRPITTAGTSAIVQAVQVPADMHRPTLSWMNAINAPATTTSHFQVSLTSAMSATVTSTLLYSTTQSTNWELQWADLSPWAGETITITFAVSQSHGERAFQVHLDKIALGAWTTPAPQAVTPAQVEFGLVTSLIISGENFIDTPQVQVGDTMLANITAKDEQYLEVDLPTTLPAGIHDITVTNPDGTATVLTGALAVGKQVYLPLVTR